MQTQVSRFKVDREACAQGHKGTRLSRNQVLFATVNASVRGELLPQLNALTGADTKEKAINMRALAGVLNVLEPTCRTALAQWRIEYEPCGGAQIGDGKPNLIYVPATGACRIFHQL